MKFLTKFNNSEILAKKLTYKENKPLKNAKLLVILKNEQKNFCAYTEKYLEGLDAFEVEHFNSSIKYNDDYFNYYAVKRKANQYKKDEEYKDATFFNTLFFQNEEEFNNRIKYADGIYVETDVNDYEAKEFIDFLGLNHPLLYSDRINHVNMLVKLFKDAKYSKKEIFNFFKNYKHALSFITALEFELKMNLSELI